MAAFGHGPSVSSEPDDPAASARNARYGLILFVVYFIGYAAFVALNAFSPDAMSRQVGGLNLSISYGLGLIAAAIVLALVYSWLCHGPAKRQAAGDAP